MAKRFISIKDGVERTEEEFMAYSVAEDLEVRSVDHRYLVFAHGNPSEALTRGLWGTKDLGWVIRVKADKESTIGASNALDE